MFGLNPMQLLGATAAVGATIAVGATCWNIGHARGYDHAATKAEIVIESKNRDLETLIGDLGQCRAANANYHAAVADQLKIIQADLVANLAAQAQADEKNALADRRMLDAATKSADNAKAAREAIQNAVDQCVRAGVPAEHIGVLNSILPQRRPGVAAGGDAVPRSGPDN